MYIFKQSMAFAMLIVKKLTAAQQYYVGICLEFRPHWSVNLKCTGRKSFTSLSKVSLSLSQLLQNSHLLIIFL
jgi:hypothetical protein